MGGGYVLDPLPRYGVPLGSHLVAGVPFCCGVPPPFFLLSSVLSAVVALSCCVPHAFRSALFAFAP
eukprot:NODE_11381_length_260_cov_37.625592_g9611_i0.p3 GENE.NODE_11381_length_260_cov_37.625592_g9611_i0~~NODE_11381_length_260_cov_37.625592_g9611_i0.p3  ORF type:complete len:75 (-),score=11.69 NODE_11381_length_260_cov_37.625592_g9611_i0:36-233(-)